MARTVFFVLAVLAVWLCCLSVEFSGDWSINSQYTPSSSSRFYVLNDWLNTYSQEPETTPLPAAKLSDIMLKTMGILRDGANWPGVLMGNLFSRPLATALFLVDGISPDSSFGDLSTTSFQVDQTGLTGCTCADTKLIFRGDNVVQHLSDLFDQDSQTTSVSANTMAAEVASANGAYTGEEQLNSLVKDIQNGQLSLAKYGLETATTKLEPTNKVDAKFIAELVLIKQSIEQLQELTSYVRDTSPDVFIFTISTLKSMEDRYGIGSSKMGVASELVKQVIQESNKALIEVYNGQVLVQALVLEWNHPDLDKSAVVSELAKAYYLLRPYLMNEEHEAFTSSLPRITLKDGHVKDVYLCSKLKDALEGTNLYAHCPHAPEDSLVQDRILREAKSVSRKKRSAASPVLIQDESTNNVTITVNNIAEDRTGMFSAIFLITLFVTVSLGLAVYAVSWALWNMDPGRDSVIYRQVSDPTVRMQ